MGLLNAYKTCSFITVMFSATVSFLTANSSLKAADLSPNVAMLLTQSTAYDLDYTSLLDLYGADYSQNNYSFVSDGIQYIGNLSGTYLGKDINVQYTGDFSDYLTTKKLSWNSNGSYGNDSWTGNGSVEIVGDSTTGFIVFYDSILNIGSNLIETSIFSEGIVTSTSLFQFTVNSGGTITYNGQIVFSSPFTEVDPIPPVIIPPKPEPPPPPPPIIVLPDKIPKRSPGEYWWKAPSLNIELDKNNNKVSRSDVDYNVQAPRIGPPDASFPPPGTVIDFRYRVLTNTLETSCNSPCDGYGSIQLEKIPEPSTIMSLLALGTLGAGATLKRQIKSSKPSEKETTKVG